MMNTVKEYIKKYNLLSQGDRVVVAVSGGPDSVVLLHVLKCLQATYDLTLTVCHLNHQLRGEAADADADFVEKLANQWGLKAYIFSQDVNQYSKRHKMSFEEGAREVRYHLFNKVMAETQSNKLAVGQNKNDQAETFFIRLFRGAGLEGLTGIKFKRDHIIRPLLGVDRQMIEAYLESNGLQARLDLTNDETIYTRNKVRHEVLPYIQKAFNEKIVDQVYTTSLLLQDDLDFIEGQVQAVYQDLALTGDAYTVAIEKLEGLHDSLLSRLIRKMVLKHLDNLKEVHYGHVKEIMALIRANKHGNCYILKDKLCFEISYDTLRVYASSEKKGLKSTAFKLNEVFTWQGQSLEVLDLAVSSRDSHTITIDADCIQGPLVVRTRQAGDRFSPLGMKGSKKLSDFMIDLKIPAFQRDDILLLCDDQEIIWVVGHRMSDHYKISGDTSVRLTIRHLN